MNGKHKSLANVKEYTANNLILKNYGISNPLIKHYEKVLNISELNLTDDSTLIFSQSQMIPIFKFIWSASQMHVLLIIFLNRIYKHGRQTLTYSQSLITIKLLFICVLIFLKQGTKHQRLWNRLWKMQLMGKNQIFREWRQLLRLMQPYGSALFKRHYI